MPADRPHAIGFWRCINYRILFPHPRELVDPMWPLKERAKLAAYLRSGNHYDGSCGYSYCRFRGGPPDEEMGSGELSDGVWVWPEGLHVYVERYSVRLPEEFLRFARGRDYKIMKVRPFSMRSRGWSFDKWIEWCRVNRSNRLLAVVSRYL